MQTARSSGAQEARNLKGRQKVKRECLGEARVKPSYERGAEQSGEKPRGWAESQNGISRRETED